MAGSRSSKRHASHKSLHEPATKRSKYASEITADTDQTSSRLLQLPRELFDMILGFVAADAGAVLHRSSTSLRSPSSLMGVSHRVRDEYQSVLNLSACTIRTEVKEFDFAHIVRFFNQLSDRELHALPSVTLPTERKFVITLMPTQALNPEQLHRWLLRLDNTTKKGTKIAADYHAPLEEDGKVELSLILNSIGYERHWPILKTLEKWLSKLDRGRLRDEVSKIRDAISPRAR